MSGRSPRWFAGIRYPYEDNFTDNTWAQIIEACQKKRIPDTWKVGDQKPMTINGVDYPIDIIGFDHDDYSDGSGKAPITFQMHDCYSEMKPTNSISLNRGGWERCDMRMTHLPAILALMPMEVQNGIREVNKLTSEGNQSSIIVTTADKLFLLSEIEIFGIVIRSKKGEGTLYDYYTAGASMRKKTRNGGNVVWRERSPSANDNTMFCTVQTGGADSTADASYSRGVAFAFCF